MKGWLAVVLVGLLSVTGGQAAGAGRAFPIASENHAIEQFASINPYIEWDDTNFLVDLSGLFANCKQIGVSGYQEVDRETPDGQTIAAVVDYVVGANADVGSVNGYIHELMDRWVRGHRYDQQIKRADRFGCSVRPGCSGHASIACLFSPGDRGTVVVTPPAIQDPSQASPRALAFTAEQYDLAEIILGNTWDRSHFIENLSGYETSCSMIDMSEWSFSFAIGRAAKRGMTVLGLFGYYPNDGSTEEAMVRILEDFKEINMGQIRGATQVGCSIIPDCFTGRGDMRQMFVVISCVYAEANRVSA